MGDVEKVILEVLQGRQVKSTATIVQTTAGIVIKNPTAYTPDVRIYASRYVKTHYKRETTWRTYIHWALASLIKKGVIVRVSIGFYRRAE